MSIWTAAALSAVMLLQQAAPATPPATPPAAAEEGPTVDALTVTAKKTPEREAIQSFVATVSDQTGNRRLGRWDRKICAGVVGMRTDYAQLILDRIAATALDVGLEVGEPGCRPNLMIIATSDSTALTKDMIRQFPDAFAKYDSAVRQSRKDLDAFAASEAPVRWWHVIGRTTADGMRYEKGEQVRVRSVGRISTGTRDDFASVIVILDVRRIGTVRFSSLADYLAMVGLAQVDPEAETGGVRSVLNLFADKAAGAEPAEALTEWDRAYLKGLYGARRDVRRGAAQEADIASTMAGELGGKGQPKKDD